MDLVQSQYHQNPFSVSNFGACYFHIIRLLICLTFKPMVGLVARNTKETFIPVLTQYNKFFFHSHD